jgi:hypothetical protein
MDLNNKINITESKMLRVPIRTIVKDIVEILKLKKVGTVARKNMEKFFNKKFFLEQHVKVEPDWRNKKALLDKLGYSA